MHNVSSTWQTVCLPENRRNGTESGDNSTGYCGWNYSNIFKVPFWILAVLHKQRLRERRAAINSTMLVCWQRLFCDIPERRLWCWKCGSIEVGWGCHIPKLSGVYFFMVQCSFWATFCPKSADGKILPILPSSVAAIFWLHTKNLQLPSLQLISHVIR